MSILNPDTSAISVHGRETLNIPYSRWSNDTQVDISASDLYIEIPAANIRRKLIANPADPKGLLIFLERDDVSNIPLNVTPFIIIDETGNATVEWEGKIVRRGYTGAPTNG